MAVDSHTPLPLPLALPLHHTTPSPSPSPLHVLVIEGHPAVGQSLVRLVGIMPGLQIRGLAMCGADGVERAALIEPDVILVDAELPRDTALTTIRQLRGCLPAARVVALGLYPDRRASMLAAGAHAFILKDAGFEALRAAIVAGCAADHAEAAGRASHRAEVTACASNLAGTIESESASVRTPGSVR